MKERVKTVAMVLFISICRGQYIEYMGDDINNPSVENREWINNPLNFDDVSKALLTLFTVSTFEGWP